MGAIMFKPVAPSAVQTCAKCFNSMLRQLRGVTVLYCGYYYRAVPADGCCQAFTNSTTKQ